MNPQVLAKYFDHTILNPAATKEQVEKVCSEAIEYGFFSVCVNPVRVKMVAQKLAGSDIKVCSVVGFPLGAATPEIKALETKAAVEDGAHEIDMVINVGALKYNVFDMVKSDIKAVFKAARGKLVKVIIETCLLNQDQKIKACEIARQAGADFVKTSTGFSTGGATLDDIALMKKTVGNDLQVKASGGIKTFEDVQLMIKAGADRIGASAGVAIIKALL
jgi:deoxyribose-phosphate aldolase